MDYEHGVIALTENKDTLAHLRNLKMLHKDASRAGKEYFVGQFNGTTINFYLGEPRTFPVNVARALEKANVTVLSERCAHCKGNGSTVAGICMNCKGRKTITGMEQYRILKVLRTYDAMLVDPASLMPVAATPVAPEGEPVVS